MAKTTQYVTVTIPANHPCVKTATHEPKEFSAPTTVRAFRLVITNMSKGTFTPCTKDWFFIVGAFSYRFEPWPEFVPTQERFGDRKFKRRDNGD